MVTSSVKTFYRITKKNPPSEKDYRTAFETRGEPPDTFSDEEKESWQAFSAYDTEDGARRQALQIPGIGKFIFRYVISEDSGIVCKPSLGPGHYDLFCSGDALRSCEAGFVANV